MLSVSVIDLCSCSGGPASWSLVLSRLRAENVLWFEVACVTSIVKYIFKSVFQHHSKFLFGGATDPPIPPPPSFAAYAIVPLLLLLRKSETLVFGILVGQEPIGSCVGCLHYYKCRHCKIWRNFWVPSPFKPDIFFFWPPLLNTYFFHGPPSNPTSNPPYLIINERSLRRFFLLVRYCIYETKL